MFDWVFAFFHLFLLLGLVGYTIYSFLEGNSFRFVILIVSLTIYYFLVLHKAVKKEIKRRRKSKK